MIYYFTIYYLPFYLISEDLGEGNTTDGTILLE